MPPPSGAVGKSAFAMVRSSSVTRRVSLSTSVRAVNLITPYCGSGETGFSTTTAARPVSRPWSQRSYCGWKIENVCSPLVSRRGHGSTSTLGRADEPPGIADMQPDRPAKTSANTSADRVFTRAFHTWDGGAPCRVTGAVLILRKDEGGEPARRRAPSRDQRESSRRRRGCHEARRPDHRG